jgi:SecD/SecF fusion protein
MLEKNLGQRFLIIAGVVLFAGLMLWTNGLRPGIDIAGGVSMMFEIDTAGAQPGQNLAEEMKVLLQRRVDPQGVYGLEWRVVGNNRLEVQMPLPPKEVAGLREAYDKSIEALDASRVTRGGLVQALNMSGAERDAALARLIDFTTEREQLVSQLATLTDDQIRQRLAEELGQGDPVATSKALGIIATPGIEARRSQARAEYGIAAAQRIERVLDALQFTGEARERELIKLFGGSMAQRQLLLPEAAAAADARKAAETAAEAARTAAEAAPEDTVLEDAARTAEIALRDADEEFNDLLEELLDTNFPLNQFRELLDLAPNAPTRTTALYQWREVQFPSLRDKIDAAIEAHDIWKAQATFLDGPEDLQRLMRGAGVLSFRILVTPNQDNLSRYDRMREQLAQRGPRTASTADEAWFKIDDPVNFFNLDSAADLQGRDPRSFTGFVVGQYAGDWYVLSKNDEGSRMLGDVNRSWQLTTAGRTQDEMGRPAVFFNFDARGGSLFGTLTGNHIDEPLAIFVDDVVYSSANILQRIQGNGRITGQFSEAKVRYLINTMNAGALPARLKDTPISERTLGSSLGEANRDRAFQAGVIGLICVGVVMLLYYWSAGLIANAALVLNIMLVLSVMAMLSARISLAGIAGIILTIGMTVDANVLIFERMREEKQRGSSLRMIIKNGYDKALSTIVDANVTTLLTSIIIYYVGSEEIKGFGLTLGWGIVTSLFTALFVTRAIFAVLLKYRLIKDIKMLQLIGTPTIDWYGMRKVFIPASAVVIVVGLSLLAWRGAAALDVEFRGGVNAEMELRDTTFSNGEPVNDIVIRNRLESIAGELSTDARKLANAQLTPLADDPSQYVLRIDGASPERVAALITEPLEDAELLARGGVDAERVDSAVVVRPVADVSADDLRLAITQLASTSAEDADQLANASINKILETEAEELEGRIWSLTSIVTNKRLVEYAIEAAMGTDLRRQSSIDYTYVDQLGRPFPVTATTIQQVIPNLPPNAPVHDVTPYLDGAAFYFTNLEPAVAPSVLQTRLRNMRLQPDYQDLPWRRFTVLGIEPTGQQDDDGHELYRSVAIVVADALLPFSEAPDEWAALLAEPELDLVMATMDNEQSLRKVSTFKPQIAGQSQQRAITALLLSWVMIIAYLWIRFGKPAYGIAGVVALVHDVLIALAAVGISHALGQYAAFNALLIHDFPINMTIVAAFLTIIGYSINDTIVIFDRVRETRGRLGVVTPQIINDSINQCMARTIMTSATTLLVLLIMYIFGGDSIRGFNYCMIVGVLTGTYSTVAIAPTVLLLGMQRADRREAQRAAAAPTPA